MSERITDNEQIEQIVNDYIQIFEDEGFFDKFDECSTKLRSTVTTMISQRSEYKIPRCRLIVKVQQALKKKHNIKELTDNDSTDSALTELNKLLKLNDFNVECSDFNFTFDEDVISRAMNEIVDLKMKIEQCKTIDSIDTSHIVDKFTKRKHNLKQGINYNILHQKIKSNEIDKSLMEKQIDLMFKSCDLDEKQAYYLKSEIDKDIKIPSSMKQYDSYDFCMLTEFVNSLLSTGLINHNCSCSQQILDLFNCRFPMASRVTISDVDRLLEKHRKVKIYGQLNYDELIAYLATAISECYDTELASKDINSRTLFEHNIIEMPTFLSNGVAKIGSVLLVEPEYINSSINWNICMDCMLENTIVDSYDETRMRGILSISSLVNKKYNPMFMNAYINEIERYTSTWKDQFYNCLKCVTLLEFEFEVRRLSELVKKCKTYVRLDLLGGFFFETESEAKYVVELISLYRRLVKNGNKLHIDSNEKKFIEVDYYTSKSYNECYNINRLTDDDRVVTKGLNLLTFELIYKYLQLKGNGKQLPSWLIFNFVNIGAFDDTDDDDEQDNKSSDDEHTDTESDEYSCSCGEEVD